MMSSMIATEYASIWNAHIHGNDAQGWTTVTAENGDLWTIPIPPTVRIAQEQRVLD